MEHVHGILLEHVYGILLDEKFLYRSVHAAFVNTNVVRDVVGAHPPFGPVSSSTGGSRVCSRGQQASLATAIT